MFSSIEAGKAALSVATQNGEKFTDNLKAMSDTSGVVESAYEKVTDTLKEKTNILKENAKNLGVTFFEGISEPLKDAADTGIDAIGRITESMTSGELSGAVSGTGEALGGLFSTIAEGAETVLPGLISGVGLLANGLTTVAPFIPTVATGILAYNASVTAATTATAAFKAISSMTFNPVGLGIAVVAAAGVGIYSIAQAAKQAREEYFKMGEDVKAASDAFSEAKSKSELTDEHITQWKELKNAISDGKVPAEEMEAAQAKLKEHEKWFVDNYGNYITAEEEKNGIRAESLDLIKQSLDAELKLRELELEDEVSAKGSEISGLKDSVEKLEVENARLEQALMNEYNEWLSNGAVGGEELDEKFYALIGKYEELRTAGLYTFEDLSKHIGIYGGKIEDANQKIDENIINISNGKESIRQFDNAVEKLTITKLGDDVGKASEKFQSLAQAIVESKNGAEITSSTLDGLIKLFPELADAADKPAVVKEKFNELKNSIECI